MERGRREGEEKERQRNGGRDEGMDGGMVGGGRDEWWGGRREGVVESEGKQVRISGHQWGRERNVGRCSNDKRRD